MNDHIADSVATYLSERIGSKFLTTVMYISNPVAQLVVSLPTRSTSDREVSADFWRYAIKQWNFTDVVICQPSFGMVLDNGLILPAGDGAMDQVAELVTFLHHTSRGVSVAPYFVSRSEGGYLTNISKVSGFALDHMMNDVEGYDLMGPYQNLFSGPEWRVVSRNNNEFLRMDRELNRVMKTLAEHPGDGF